MYNTCNDMSNTKFKPGDTVEVVSVEKGIIDNWMAKDKLAVGVVGNVATVTHSILRLEGRRYYHPAKHFKLIRSGAGPIDNDLK
jgi:hypothetical protein